MIIIILAIALASAKTHPFNVAAIAYGDVDSAAGVVGVFVLAVCALVRMHVAKECKVHSVLVQQLLNLLLEALHLLVVAVVCIVAATRQVL